MATIAQFDPPGGLDDFDSIPNQRLAWSEFLFNTFQDNIQGVEQSVGAGKSQFYNPRVADTPEPNSLKKIHWRGFPLLIAEKHPGNKTAAWKEADQPLANGERPQDEYLEWFVEKDARGKNYAGDIYVRRARVLGRQWLTVILLITTARRPSVRLAIGKRCSHSIANMLIPMCS